MNVWNPEHPHHAVWREYTQSLLDGKPKAVECRVSPTDKWQATNKSSWYAMHEYRIARLMLTLTYSVPMPVTERLEYRQDYWTAEDSEHPNRSVWHGDSDDLGFLRAGLIYLTEADAQAAIDAHLAAMTAALEGAK